MARRVVSLVPSLTESALALGVTPVACTRFCEQPGLATVGGTKNPDIGAIKRLAPDVVLMDREENRREDAEALTAAGVAVHVTHVVAVADVGPMLTRLADVLDVAPVDPDEALPAPSSGLAPLRAFVPIWRRPWMSISASTYGGSLLEWIGVVNVVAARSDAYPVVELDEVAHLQPQVALLPSEPYSFEARHVAELRDAVPDCRVVHIDGQDLFWWGVRTPGAIARLRAEVDAIVPDRTHATGRTVPKPVKRPSPPRSIACTPTTAARSIGP